MGKSRSKATVGKDRPMTPEMYIKRAVYLGNFTILFETNDGQKRIIDFKPMLEKNMGEFASLREEEVFKTFYLDTGILTWDIKLPIKSDKQINQFDVAPEYIYTNSKSVQINKNRIKVTG